MTKHAFQWLSEFAIVCNTSQLSRCQFVHGLKIFNILKNVKTNFRVKVKHICLHSNSNAFVFRRTHSDCFANVHIIVTNGDITANEEI